jgi:hypothetical protein
LPLPQRLELGIIAARTDWVPDAAICESNNTFLFEVWGKFA